MNIYLGNLAREPTEEELREAFSEFGEVTYAKIIPGLNGKDLKRRTFTVNEARPRPDDHIGGG